MNDLGIALFRLWWSITIVTNSNYLLEDRQPTRTICAHKIQKRRQGRTERDEQDNFTNSATDSIDRSKSNGTRIHTQAQNCIEDKKCVRACVELCVRCGCAQERERERETKTQTRLLSAQIKQKRIQTAEPDHFRTPCRSDYRSTSIYKAIHVFVSVIVIDR